MLSSKNSNKSNSLLKVSLLSSQTMEKSIQLKTYSFSNPFTKNINCLVQRTLSLVLKLVLKKNVIGGQEWLQETLIMRFIIRLTIILSLRTIFKKIISANVFPKVHLPFQTQFTYLVDKYKKNYVIEKEA